MRMRYMEDTDCEWDCDCSDWYVYRCRTVTWCIGAIKGRAMDRCDCVCV